MLWRGREGGSCGGGGGGAGERGGVVVRGVRVSWCVKTCYAKFCNEQRFQSSTRQ